MWRDRALRDVMGPTVVVAGLVLIAAIGAILLIVDDGGIAEPDTPELLELDTGPWYRVDTPEGEALTACVLGTGGTRIVILPVFDKATITATPDHTCPGYPGGLG